MLQHQTPISPTASPTHYFSTTQSSSSSLPPIPPNHDALELEAVVEASKASAQAERERRARQQHEEEEHFLALHRSEEESRRIREAEENDAVQQAVLASRREEEEAQKRRIAQEEEEEQQSQLLMEESRQTALREEERRIQREHSDLLARSKVEAEEAEALRKLKAEEAIALEEVAIKESLREMQKEWQRREEEERAVEAFEQQGGKRGNAAYWQHLNHQDAYNLAVEMDSRLSVSGASSSGPSRIVRPLPPTPGLAAQAAGVERPKEARTHGSNALVTEEEEWSLSDDQVLDSENDETENPFSDAAEAPPMYDDVRVDRPPNAPDFIPEHIRFARPESFGAGHNNTIQSLPPQLEKSPAFTASMTSASSQISTSQSSHRDPLRDHNDGSTDTSDTHPTSVAGSHMSVQHNEDQEDPGNPRTSSDKAVVGSSNTTQEVLQRAMKGTEFGYANEPFARELSSRGVSSKGHFPNRIQLRAPRSDGSLQEPNAYFVVRAPSWKALLRAMAWYGNTRVEAGPEEVADSASTIPLAIETEFVTPAKADIANSRHAQASVCFSLILPQNGTNHLLTTALKQASRALDASYMRQGVTRRVVVLPRKAPKLPIDVVRLAQIMHEAHTFSAACPSTGASALHSPRDLHHAIERHDIGFVAKVQRLRRQTVEASNETSLSSGVRRSSNALARLRNKLPTQDEELYGDVDSDSGTDDDGDLDAGAVEVVQGAEADDSRLTRMRARVRRRLAKRSGDARVTDADLESWISEYISAVNVGSH